MALLRLIDTDNTEDNEKKDYKRKPIKFYINTNGGALADMYAISDIITNSKTPIYTYCTGYAMSSGFKIFLAGSKRFITRHTTLMYHQLSTRKSGKYQDLVEDGKQLDYFQNIIEEYVLERTIFTKEDLNKIREQKIDYYIHPNEAIELGIADEIVNTIEF